MTPERIAEIERKIEIAQDDWHNDRERNEYAAAQRVSDVLFEHAPVLLAALREAERSMTQREAYQRGERAGMMKTKPRTYLFEYHYDGATFGLDVPAYSEDEARERVKRMSCAQYVGTLERVIPAGPTTGFSVRLLCWWRNLRQKRAVRST